jgi:hypothetical protein
LQLGFQKKVYLNAMSILSILLSLEAGCHILVLAATSLGSSTRIGLGTLPRLWSRWGVPGMTFYGLGALVCQAEELYDILYVMRGELL